MIDPGSPWHPQGMTSPLSPRIVCLAALSLCSFTLAACSDDNSAGEDDFADDVGDSADEGDWGEDGTGGDEGAGGDDGGGPADTGGDGEDPQPGQLTAGEWSDLDNWDFWRGLAAPDSPWLTEFDHWDYDTSVRLPVLALAGETDPAVDLAVVVRDAEGVILWEARTNNEGEAELWPALDPETVDLALPLSIEAGNASVQVDTLPDETAIDPYVLDVGGAGSATGLDVMFVVDTTGSMQDELDYLKAELGDVITRVDEEVGGDLELRLSVNFYRDHGDDYVVQPFPFTTDVDTALAQIAAQSADGGGDWEEAVEAALSNAIFEHEWSGSARARLLFLVLDAPPHDTAENRMVLRQTIEEAASLGVRVIPVGASGIDKRTEFLLRDLDIATGGTYTFLTDHSGIGGEHLEPTVGEYQVELFNDLMVRLIVEAMS